MPNYTLITGASKGIGKSLAHVFAQNGYSLLLVARTTSELEALQADLTSKYHCDVKILSVDLSQPQSVDTIMSAFKDEMRELEVLVNNAGFGSVKKFSDMPAIDVDGMINVNILTLTKLTYRILPFMQAKQRGKILNIASVASYSAGPYMAEYCATKAYVLSLSEALHDEYKEEGITVTVACPGVTETSFKYRAGMEKSPIMTGKMPIMTADEVAALAYAGLMKNKRVVVTGMMNKISVFMMRFIPRSVAAKLSAQMMKPKE